MILGCAVNSASIEKAASATLLQVVFLNRQLTAQHRDAFLVIER